MKRWEGSLKKLLDAIPPPAQPKFLDGPLLDPSLPKLPDDHDALLRAYGSGEFAYGEIGCVIEIFNPRDPWHLMHYQKRHERLRQYRESEGEKYMPYPIFPDCPGVLNCGWNDSRDYWFWRIKGSDPNRWSTVFYGDMKDAFEFKMPLVVFMQKLFFGEISRRELNFAEPDFSPKGFEFRPSWRKGKPK